jgi:ADP-ribose pyrophosphatase YjhB (NUDIX family)
MPTPPFLAQLRTKIGHELVLVPTVVVIARDPAGRVLLVHDRDAQTWTLPGGIMEPGESPADAAVREVWEETHLLAELTHLIGVVGGPGCETTYRNGDRLAWVATLFAAVVDGVPVPDGTETSAARLVAPDVLASMTLREDSLRFLSMERQARGGAACFQPSTWRPAQRSTAS